MKDSPLSEIITVKHLIICWRSSGEFFFLIVIKSIVDEKKKTFHDLKPNIKKFILDKKELNFDDLMI